eukprot:TRINITY_DN8761_c0_g1_i1.p1 TRINITY_DN8761_c0_g1~~TRINITY_DN8761_c0_g1_i1.p1  ORF type:complete len:279 (-),score=71.91 TRINITY_DN8761_c0_g1_i1:35-838(-)
MSTLSIDQLKQKIQEYNEQLEEVNYLIKEYPKYERGENIKSRILASIRLFETFIDMKNFSERKDTMPKFQDISRAARSRGIFLGMQCEAVWKKDGEWYKATVVNMTDYGILVKFTEYNEELLVHPDQIRMRETLVMTDEMKERGDLVNTTASAKSMHKKKELAIPSSLMILPTDTEEDRRRKKRSIRSIQKKAATKVLEAGPKKRKMDWQSFSRGAKRQKTKSIFSSTPDGRVGFTSKSGSGMTQIHKPRVQKKKLNPRNLPNTRRR